MCGKYAILGFAWLCIFCTFTVVVSKKSECGALTDPSKIPWIVGIYLEKENNNLELVCLGTILKENYVLTAAQCVCESLSRDVRKEHIYVSTEFRKQLETKSNAIRVKTKDITSRSDYEGFLLKPAADLAILKLEQSQKMGSSVCIDWSDLNFLLKDDATGIFPLWDNQLKKLDTTFLDYDTCTLSASEEFGSLLGYDKNCFKLATSDLVPESIGSGIFFKNPNDNKWYLEGVVSGKEASGSGVFVAATSVRRYLSWLSRVCTV